MNRYADPQRCPDCLGRIDIGSPACPHCRLSLAGPLPGRLFQTLSQADNLLARMRQATPVAGGEALVSVPAGTPTATRRGGRLRAASVPTLLLSLGAVCLLVAALVFLAVTWSVMGVGGRTATLAGLTGVVGAVAAFVARRGLSAAAESLCVVGLGLLAFDLVGAQESGWLGDLGGPGFLVLLGAVLAAIAGSVAVAARRTPVHTLVGAEVVGALAAATAIAGFVDGGQVARSASLTISVLAAATATYAAHRLSLRCLTVGLALVTTLVWVALAATALERGLSNPTLDELWLELDAWPLVVAGVLALTAASLRAFVEPARVLAIAAGEVMLAAAALVPFTQGSLTEATLAVLVLVLVGGALAELTSGHRATGSALALAPGALWAAGVGAEQLVVAGERLVRTCLLRVWDGTLDGRLPEVTMAQPRPWLLPLVAVTLLVTGVVLVRLLGVAERLLTPAAGLPVGTAAIAVSGVAALASYPVPVWSVLGVALVAAVLLTGAALYTGRSTALLAGCGFLAVGVGVSLHDDGLTSVAAGVVLLLAGATFSTSHQRSIGLAAGGVAAIALSGSVWTWGTLAELQATWVALTVVLLLGALVLGVSAVGAGTSGRPTELLQRFPGFEAGAALSGSLAAVAGVAAAPDSSAPTWTTVYLTGSGVLVSALALARVDRRGVGWLGGGLLAAATWVRLWDAGVEIPEAYTLPSAAALLVAGVWHLHRRRGSSTMPALAAGLSLATVPSLLWVLGDPVSLRAMLLGLGALALVVLGVRLGWTAPLVFGSAVGLLVVLRQLVAAADVVPQWVLIASAGMLLVTMGITWERRIQEARAAFGYLQSLR